jgi:hypothetical protein
MNRIVHSVVFVSIVVLCWGVLIARPTHAQDSSPPVTGAPDTVLTFSVDGFQPDEPVNYWISLPDDRVVMGNVAYQVTADRSGRAVWQWRIPPYSPPDTWLMVARGRESGILHTTPIMITSVPDMPVAPIAFVEPQAGAPGTTFSFFARDFETDESIVYWINTPDGELIGSREFRISNEDNDDGRIRWEWSVPPDAPRGTWSMAVRGTESNRERLIFFDVP